MTYLEEQILEILNIWEGRIQGFGDNGQECPTAEDIVDEIMDLIVVHGDR